MKGSHRRKGSRRRGAVAIAAALAGLAVLPLAAAGDAGSKEERRSPWRAIDVKTRADAAKAWKMVRAHFGNLRKGHPHEVWVTDRAAMPPARPIPECLAELSKRGLAFPRVDKSCVMSAQVRVGHEVSGVRFGGRMEDGGPELVVGCELALRLPAIAAVLRRERVRRVEVGPPARAADRSYHRFGLALDVYELGLDDGTSLVVEQDFAVRRDRGTCEGDPPAEAKARRLRRVACRLFESRQLSTVITPNYNDGHRDHFHWDVRPGDERFYLR